MSDERREDSSGCALMLVMFLVFALMWIEAYNSKATDRRVEALEARVKVLESK